MLTYFNYILQFFFIRIYKGIEDNKIVQWGIMYWIIPFTGWTTNYKHFGKMNLKAIWKKK